jgi:hypothetical protein
VNSLNDFDWPPAQKERPWLMTLEILFPAQDRYKNAAGENCLMGNIPKAITN